MAQSQRHAEVEPDPVANRLWTEQLAVLMSTTGGGFPLTAGRILGHMLLSAQPTTTQAELSEALGVSQASVSSALPFLFAAGYLERSRVPGSRREQYALREQSWEQIAHGVAVGLQASLEHLERGLALPGPDLSAGRVHLRRLADLFADMHALFAQAATRRPSGRRS